MNDIEHYIIMDKEQMALLFDFDGVVMDTETQYTHFWDEQGQKHLQRDNFCALIKGQTLGQIFDKYFINELYATRAVVEADLNRFEEQMSYEYIPGAQQFITSLRQQGVPMALVTSSGQEKMNRVYRIHPELKEYFDCIITGEMVTHSKPNPECFLKAIHHFGVAPAQCIVFEDSLHGLAAGQACGAFVVGLSTTYPHEVIVPKAHTVIANFEGCTLEKILTIRAQQDC